MEIRFLARSLAEGLSGWLAFEFNAHRGPLFSEGYITPAVGQILQSFSNGEKIGCEVTHPLLRPPERGRPYQIDYIIGDESSPRVAIEAKWASWTTPPVGKIVADLLRLALLADRFDTQALFVLAGRASTLDTLKEKLPCLSFSPEKKDKQRKLRLSALEELSGAAVADIRAIALSAIPEHVVITGPVGRVEVGRKLAFQAYVWRLKKTPRHLMSAGD